MPNGQPVDTRAVCSHGLRLHVHMLGRQGCPVEMMGYDGE
jgi:hypothetical protein